MPPDANGNTGGPVLPTEPFEGELFYLTATVTYMSATITPGAVVYIETASPHWKPFMGGDSIAPPGQAS